jgi:hypothetical protein
MTTTLTEVEWENSTSFDTLLPSDAVFVIEDMPLDELVGRYGSFASYSREEPERMAGMVEDFDDLPIPAFWKDDRGYHHLDGAHRVVTALHLGRTHLRAYVHHT